MTLLLKKSDQFKKKTAGLSQSYLYSTIYQAILSDFMGCYRRFYSCDKALIKLTEDWRSVLYKGELVDVVSVDL